VTLLSFHLPNHSDPPFLFPESLTRNFFHSTLGPRPLQLLPIFCRILQQRDLRIPNDSSLSSA
jgi:hypothetical protein